MRVGKGLYENDLAKIEKINKNYVVVTAVPRINIQDLELRMREEASKLNDEEKIKEKKH